jgi:hypothetical protein
MTFEVTLSHSNIVYLSSHLHLRNSDNAKTAPLGLYREICTS